MSFVSELRRRQVFRTAAWYGGLAWLAVEVADTVFPRFGLPDWSVRAVIVGAALGLPLALALAWSFDLSALGIRRETGVVPAPSDRAGFPSARSAAPLWRIPSFWIALAIAVGLTVSAQQAWQRLIRPAFGERPGLAVLPFANLSPDPENAYFADGLHEEILAALARAGGLRVISRTSVQEYRDPKRNLREIADALDVSLILEGSVRASRRRRAAHACSSSTVVPTSTSGPRPTTAGSKTRCNSREWSHCRSSRSSVHRSRPPSGA